MAWRTRDVTVPVVAPAAHAAVNVPTAALSLRGPVVSLHGVPTLKPSPWVLELCFVFCVVCPPRPYFCARQSLSP